MPDICINPRLSSVFCLILILALTGCGGGGEPIPELGQVTGVVTMDGAPLSNAKIIFEPQQASDKARRRASSATTQTDGSYTLEYNSDAAGATPGTHKVMILKMPDNPDDAGTQLVPAKYNDKTELTAEVKTGENSFNFDLK
ncbi:MAG: carboxypeptidase regulatory-like domain-containing protein, partial [Planctomycetaceae bacterium]|nr:carboxypeptidase regulatory-like domain-containing protein [Planctomycetaceae bacterium]